MISRVKGTHDLLPDRMALFNYVVNKAAEHCALYHYHQIDTPHIEYLDLFKRSLGIHTDVVSKEMFVIDAADKEEDKICLRPEVTAPVMRLFMNESITQAPWKVFVAGSMFRYERPQKGRFREFHQFSIECIAAQSIYHDVELIVMLDRLFSKTFNLTEYGLLVNFLGCAEDRKKYSVIVKEFLQKRFGDICETCRTRLDANTLRIFDCKNPACQEIYKDAPKTIEHLCTDCEKEWQTLTNTLGIMSVSFSPSHTLVRGLDYYNKTVFEFASTQLGAQTAFCGGGRYDHLSQALGGEQAIPACGAGIGLERLMMLIENSVVLPQTHAKRVCILPLGSEQYQLSLLLADELRHVKILVDVLVDDQSMKGMMRKADKLGATHVVIIGENERLSGKAQVKHMLEKKEVLLTFVEIVEYLKK